MRQDPPFDMSYITATHILEKVQPSTLVVNDPAGVRNAPEKLFVTDFEGVMPPTLITHSTEAVRTFRDEHGDIIIKPLYGNGGEGVFHIPPGDENLASLLEMFARTYREPMMVQAYLPEVRQGDKLQHASSSSTANRPGSSTGFLRKASHAPTCMSGAVPSART